MKGYLRRLSDRRQLTIPPRVLKEAGLVREETLFMIHAEDGRIILEPREVSEEGLVEEDWTALDRLVKQQVRRGQYKDYPDPGEAKRHLRRHTR